MLLLSILEGLYIVYMFVFFKTKYSLEVGRWNHELWPSKIIKKHTDIDLTRWFVHPIEKSEKPESQICLFGKWGSLIILIFLVLRHYILNLKKINTYFFVLVFILSLMNYDATLYLLPVFLIELVFRPLKIFKKYLN